MPEPPKNPPGLIQGMLQGSKPSRFNPGPTSAEPKSTRFELLSIVLGRPQVGLFFSWARVSFARPEPVLRLDRRPAERHGGTLKTTRVERW